MHSQLFILSTCTCRCSCDCILVIDSSPDKIDAEPYYHLCGHLRGLSDDQIAYVSQSADHREGVIIMAKKRRNEVCRAAILRKNYPHTDTKLYIAFDRHNGLKVRKRFNLDFHANSKVSVHVKFELKNSYFRNLCHSVWQVPQDIIAKIMPDSQSLCDFSHQKLEEEYLPKCSLSEDQIKALEMIFSSPTNGPPSLVTGPFGTGKSHLLAAAAYYQFRKGLVTRKPARILVCTQQRESADSFCQLYHGIMPKESDATVFIVREYGYQTSKLKKWYKSIDQFKDHMEKIDDANSDNIKNFLIIMPCLTALRVQKKNFLPPYFFTHIFIDEGAQMREPEALAPLLLSSENTKIVIAGDPCQVILNFSHI